MVAALTAIPLVSFINFAQPFLLNEVFNVPESEQGVLTGQLAALQELIVLSLMGFVGAASDNFGRRVIMITGLLFIAFGLAIYPLASSVNELYGYRVLFAIGAAMVPVMYSATVHDIASNKSRGLFTALGSFCTGLGMVLVSTQLGKLPTLLVESGINPVDAGRYTYWVMVGLAVIVIVLVRLLWKAGHQKTQEAKEPLLNMVKGGFAEASKNPRIALAYLTAFASRGDLVVIGTFLSLWLVQSASDFNFTSAEGLKRAGIMVAVIQATAMVWAIIMGICADRINRVLAVLVGFSIATFGYMQMSLVDNPYASSALIACVILGMGEISTIVTGSALIGQEAPAEKRGSVIGVFSLIGAFAILVFTYVGGVVFDGVGRTAPFMMMGIVNGIVVIAATFVLLRFPEKTPPDNNH